jgi:serine/threonine protein kinase
VREVSIPLEAAVRIMHQISTALAYMHDRGICHCAVDAPSVLLIERDLIDPIAKLSNFSHCKSKAGLFKKDIVDFANLLNLVSTSRDAAESDSSIQPTTSKQTASSTVRKEWFPSLARLIGAAQNCRLAVSQIAHWLSDIDANMRTSTPKMSSPIRLQGEQDGRQEVFDDVEVYTGCFPTKATSATRHTTPIYHL